MPKDTIERAIKRGAGGLEGVNYEEIRYEGYGINGAAVIVDCMTDNRTRTVADVRHAFTKYGGNLGTDGSVAFLFKHCGQLVFAPGTDEDKLMEAALEAGAEDVVANDDGSLEVVTGPYDFVRVKDALAKAGFKAEFAEVTMKAATEIEIRRRGRGEDAEAARRARSARRRAGGLHVGGARRHSVKAPTMALRRILGIDPGLRVTGFGVLVEAGRQARLRHERLHPRERRQPAGAPRHHRARHRARDRRRAPDRSRGREASSSTSTRTRRCCSARRAAPRSPRPCWRPAGARIHRGAGEAGGGRAAAAR